MITTRFRRSWLRDYTGAQVAVGSKIADLGRTGSGCFASDSTIGGALGLARTTVNGAVRALSSRDDLRTTASKRATRTRWVRWMGEKEQAVTISAYARDTLASLGSALLVYAELSFHQDTNPEGDRPVPVVGVATACGLSEEAVRLALRELEARGWITCTREGGGRGHTARYAVHDLPVPGRATAMTLDGRARPDVPEESADTPAPGPAETAPLPGQGALFQAADLHGNPQISRQETPNCGVTKPPTVASQNRPSLVGGFDDAGVVGGFGSTEGDGRWAREELVDNSGVKLHAVDAGPDVALRAEPHKPNPTPGNQLPPLTVSARVAYVMAELRPLMDRITHRWQQREIGRAIGRTLDAEGGDPERLASRVRFRVATTNLHGVTSPYGWITRLALARRGCANPDCESGLLWSTGEDCRACAVAVEERRAEARARRALQAVPPPRTTTDALAHPHEAPVPHQANASRVSDAPGPVPAAPAGVVRPNAAWRDARARTRERKSA